MSSGEKYEVSKDLFDMLRQLAENIQKPIADYSNVHINYLNGIIDFQISQAEKQSAIFDEILTLNNQNRKVT